jgi:TetR/AcrR family transcriptional regulator
VGRPRAIARELRLPPEEEILIAAARLFAQKGFARTTTREIAAAVGLRQPSLFHYYPSKEAILEALLNRSIVPSVAFFKTVKQHAPAKALYEVLKFDVRQLCALPYDLESFVLSPEARQPRFSGFWRERKRLISGIQFLVEAGMRTGHFDPGDAALTARAIMGMCESVLGWYPRRGPWSPEQVGEQLAQLTLRALRRNRSR